MTTRSTKISFGALYVVLAGMLWGTTGTAQALGPSTSNPLAVGALRLIVAGIALALMSYCRGGLRSLSWPWGLVFLGGALVALYQATFFSGVALAGVAVGTIVGIGSAPIFAGVLEIIFFRQKPRLIWYLSTTVALCGCALLLFAENGGADSWGSFLGVLLALCAGLSYAGTSLIMKTLLQEREAEEVTAMLFCVGAVLLTPVLFYVDISWLFSPSGFVMILHLGLFSMALAYLLFVKGLEVVPVSTAVTLALTEPMTAGLLAVFVLDEKLCLLSGVGLVLIFFAVLFLLIPQKAKIEAL
ncbi:DMT family transporter [Desulfotalea psychrophila]|uniref:Conserved hypothetical membrane protein n=1 Tax=Desulfotalea psychrophila (strain LSv54 / DSM 12343) TaxID=177439 RepID=Q6AL50_DESPS|nr:DMT family transporter [Desulfotalea psychrophila]CAG36925.1 conserved hypothetical membrane protein [Desulfotalea psychrophila LSv54]